MPLPGRRLTDASLSLIIAVCLCAPACARPAASAASAAAGGAPAPGVRLIAVVGAENFYGDVLVQICGSRCSVTSILSEPDADPHTYESNANDAATIARARLVVENGAGYDAFIDHLLAASPTTGRLVITVGDLDGTAAGANPHLWYDPATMAKVADAVATDLAKLDPADASDYRAAATRFSASLQPLDAEIATIREAHPGVPVAYTEPVFAYMGEALGLTVESPASFLLAVEDGQDPPASAVAEQQDLLDHHRVSLFIYNLQAVTPLTARLRQRAAADGIPVVGVTETEPPGTTYQTWMLDQLSQVQSALAEGGAPSAR